MNNEVAIRLGFFLGIFIIVAICEVLSPRRDLNTSKPIRWLSNMSVVFIDSVLVHIIFPVLAVGLALIAEKNGWGLLNNYNIPYWFSIVVGVLVLDFIIYLQHVMFHAVPILWRLHMMHHADLDYDVTTALRFHPLEIIISMIIKLSAIAVLGPSALSVLIFEVVLNGTAMFNHGNIRLPLKIDRFLRLLVVTPDMHRVHHSVIIRETNSNFGFNFPWWDRLFGTYRAQPAAGHEGMTIGLSQFRDAKRLTLPWMLSLPFIGNPGEYSLNRSGREPVFKKPQDLK
jgi:sterol desaturase/sphingolipid hydroxylase (fatty acid hydroxylase superfamily)